MRKEKLKHHETTGMIEGKKQEKMLDDKRVKYKTSERWIEIHGRS